MILKKLPIFLVKKRNKNIHKYTSFQECPEFTFTSKIYSYRTMLCDPPINRGFLMLFWRDKKLP